MHLETKTKLGHPQRAIRRKAVAHARIAGHRGPERNRKLGIRSILVPIDFSETSRLALQVAAKLAKDYRASISLIHVVLPEIYDSLSASQLSQRKITFVESATARLVQLAQIEVPRAIAVNPWVQIGVPHEEIARAAKILNADLIVIATHGHASFQQVLMGSTAERVVRHASCPVFVVRRQEPSNSKKL